MKRTTIAIPSNMVAMTITMRMMTMNRRSLCLCSPGCVHRLPLVAELVAEQHVPTGCSIQQYDKPLGISSYATNVTECACDIECSRKI
jgi:hypothetical protein